MGALLRLRKASLDLDVVEAPDVAEVAGEHPVVGVRLIAVGEGDARDGIPAEVAAEPGDVEPGVPVSRLVHRRQMRHAELAELPGEHRTRLRDDDAAGVYQRLR